MTIASLEIQNHILLALKQLGDDLDIDVLKSAHAETALIGRRSDIDSITLVSIIVDVEERLADELNINVILADERAMSQRSSPFRSVQSLTNYVVELHQASSQT